jgi:ADP-ribosylglycohydrolase
VWGCLAEAVWAVRSTDSFEAAVIAAIELGGDTDTVACVAGALAGAIYGVQAIPSRWVTYLHGTVSTPVGVRR